MTSPSKPLIPSILPFLVFLSGLAALSWEILWQIKSSLALGVSAWGAALTLAVMMGGMCLGGLWLGTTLHNRQSVKPLKIYAILEIIIGCCGLLLNTAFGWLEKIDTQVYAVMPGAAPLVYLLGITAILVVPAFCMGATLPVFKLVAKQFQLSISRLYSLNTLGAGVGVLIAAFLLIPLLGLTHTIWTIVLMNLGIGLLSWMLAPKETVSTIEYVNAPQPEKQNSTATVLMLVFVTGFATFSLEIAWFRSFMDILPNTTDIFAIMLACVLVALSMAARKVPMLKQKQRSLGTQICLAGILILLVTPLIERLDVLVNVGRQAAVGYTQVSQMSLMGWIIDPVTFQQTKLVVFLYALQVLLKCVVLFCIIVPPMRYLGMALPWMLDDQSSAKGVGRLYAVNTLAAILGSLGAAWLLLPLFGFAKTAWIAGALVLAAGVAVSPGRYRYLLGSLGVIALVIAVQFETGIGKTHIQGFFATDVDGHPSRLLAYHEGPDATYSAIEYQDGSRALIINSTGATWESGKTPRPSIHYMGWMGHLPMLLHPNPKKALVICFGTGQTANAVREENPETLDIVDVSPNVFKLASYFRSNKNVLQDPRVTAITMDGRAYLRRTKTQYDVITLEPMPPSNAGVNALYSKEFYELAKKQLTPDGVIAQWLPFHIVAPAYSASMAKTFMEVFPNAVLWIDRDSATGILLGSNNANHPLTVNWPGFSRASVERNLSETTVRDYVAMNQESLKRYAMYGAVITDDNQLLSYGRALYAMKLLPENYDLLHRIDQRIEMPAITTHYW